MVCWRDRAEDDVRLFCLNHGSDIFRPLRADLFVALKRFGSLPVKIGAVTHSPTPLAFPGLPLLLLLLMLLLLLVADMVLHFLKKLKFSFESFVFVGVSRVYFVRFVSSLYFF